MTFSTAISQLLIQLHVDNYESLHNMPLTVLTFSEHNIHTILFVVCEMKEGMTDPTVVPDDYITGTPVSSSGGPKDSRLTSNKGWVIEPATLAEEPYLEIRLVPRDAEVTPILVGKVVVKYATGDAPSYTVKYRRDEESTAWTPYTENGVPKVRLINSNTIL